VTQQIRNIAIIAHVDHGKTTLVDRLLQQSGTLKRGEEQIERALDSNELEKERGITILAKNTAIAWQGNRINIVDTPGHADFGGEVERVLSMVDSVLLLVDAVDGPMPQTRFVTQKAFAQKLNPIVVVNKVDRPGARPHWAVDQVFDLFINLGATEDQLDFPVVYCSALNGIAGLEPDALAEDMAPLFETIMARVPAPQVDLDGPLQMRISTLDYSSYLGIIGIGRINRGRARRGQPVTVVAADGSRRAGKLATIMGYMGLGRVEVEEAEAGDIVCVTGFDELNISDTLCDPALPEALPALSVEEPTVSMTFQVNTSPFAGREGKYVTSRKIKERLEEELKHNVALRVEATDSADRFRVSGRGELHLGILIETMRREGYELGVSKPEVIIKVENGERFEPFEELVVDIEETHQGAIMETLGARRGELQEMVPDGKGRVRLRYRIPARALIGFRSDFMTMTSGSGIMSHNFLAYGKAHPGDVGGRNNGVLIANGQGKALGFALFNLQNRGRLFIGPGEEVYEGMVIGIHSRDNDLVVNPLKGKQLTNIRAAGSDENIVLTPPIRMTLERALEFIAEDELVEVTPGSIRLRKKQLKESDRRRDSRSASSE
jgi:GTP-binding protein